MKLPDFATMTMSFPFIIIALFFANNVQGKLPTINLYQPNTDVRDELALDLDTVAISAFTFQQTAEFFELAKKVYREGADSGSYAIVKTGWLMRGYAAGSEVTGKTTAGMTIKGKLLRSTGLFTSKLYIAYDVGSPQLPCRVGGLPAVHQDTAGCFESRGEVIVAGRAVKYRYTIATGNKNSRSLSRISLNSYREYKSFGNGVYYQDFRKFVNYYGFSEFANKIVMGAFENQMVKFKTAGIFDFRQWGFKGRAIAVQHASFMIVTLQVIGELEKALDEYARCYEPRDTCSAVKSVDQAVAYYVGSLAADGKGDGNLMSTLADFSCIEMKTCDYTGDSLTGPAKVNLEIIPLFWLMKDAIVNRHFAQAKSYKEAIAAKMFIPLIQSLLRFTYENQYVIQSEETEAQAFMFATSILPLVHDCNPNDATTILTNLRIGQEGTLEFASVKAAIENNYECMQITCEDIGGIYDSTNAKYYDGAGPCTLA